MNAVDHPAIPVGTLVCEPQIDRTPYTVEGADAIAPGQVLLAPADPVRRLDRATWYYAWPSDLELLAAPLAEEAPAPRRVGNPIRFPFKYDRREKARMPVAQKVGGGWDAQAKWCIREAIGLRRKAAGRLAKARILAELNDHRGADIERRLAACDRQSMRLSALWARCWAEQIRDRDPRMLEIERARHDQVWRSFRATHLSERWRRVQAMKIVPALDDSRRRRIDSVLARIACKHAAIEPWGYTLPQG